MTTDRELLELAAKAAGYCICEPLRYGEFRVCNPGQNHLSFAWSPLTDDGDALRLFCAFPWLAIETSDVGSTVRERGSPDKPSRVYLMWTEWLENHDGDLKAATRRAIVRAAAEIGRGMK